MFFIHYLLLLMSVFSFLIPSINLTIYLQQHTERSATYISLYFIASVFSLKVSIHFRIYKTFLNIRPVSCYAFFKGWLPLSPPPDCHSNNISLSTKLKFKDLSLYSGLFPSRHKILSPYVRLLYLNIKYSEFI